MITIRKFAPSNSEKERRFLLDLPSIENGFENPAKPDDLSTSDAFNSFIQRKIDAEQGIGLDPNHVPNTTFWIKNDGKNVAFYWV